ncbi:MAG: Appr-1-p processing protein [endosymbiont of Galathealinum brachiosum]|uniref:Appr-1-p processing protein n=1 Tax=endosymbiont of Galathealinum brachiosum TaxID=2200906 RepID=A0A370DEM6_9GAMM|nr:MAG: Appr-1-p processing protein [endosymbiont of Galathealinum brachiosum]
MKAKLISGNILQQDVEVIVNSWNRNIIPWWLLLPQGVSGAIKKACGTQHFKELAKYGAIPLGESRETSAGRLNFKAIIHVAGINMFWFATEYSVKQSVISAMQIVNQKKYISVAFPLIGSGSGNRGDEWALNVMNEALSSIESNAKVIFVKYE